MPAFLPAWSTRLLNFWPGHAAALLALVVAAWAGPAASAEPLRLAVSRTPLSLPLFVAQDKGYFAGEGVDVQVVDCVGGPRCMRMMFEAQADLATAADLPVVFASFERSDFAVIATFVSSSDDLKLVARSGSGIENVAGLAGRKVGLVTNSAAQYFLDLNLFSAGVDPRGVQLVSLQPEDMQGALQSGRVDAVAIWEPFGYLAGRAEGRVGKVLPGTTGYLETFNLLAHRRVLGLRDTELAQLLRALERAEQFIQREPEEAKAILRRRLGLAQAFVDWVWPGLSYRLSLDQSLLTTLEAEARWAQREGLTSTRSRPNLLPWLYATPLRSVKPTAVGIER